MDETIGSKEELVKELAETLEMANAEMTPYIDLAEQTVWLHMPDGMGDDISGHSIVEIAPLSPHESFEIMEAFAEGLRGLNREYVLRSMEMRHPFQAFKQAIRRCEVEQDWYDFKTKKFLEIAAIKLEDAGVDFVAGKIVCSIKGNIKKPRKAKR